MAIEGPLKELHIHDVFQLLDLGRKTGVLRVRSELRQNDGTVFLEGGAVVGAEIRSNPHPLGRLLMRAGKVTEQDVARATDMQPHRQGERLGELLVEIGAISRKALDQHIRAQVEEVIFELMSWSEGYFAFEESAAGASTAEAIYRIPTESLLMEAARRIDEWSRFESKIPNLEVIPQLNTDQMGTATVIDLLPDEWALLATIDGTSSVRHLAQGLGRSDFDVAKILFGLASAGIIVIQDPTVVTQPGERELAVLVAHTEDLLSVADVEAAEITAREAVNDYHEESVAHLILGRVLLAVNRFDEATIELEDAVELDATSAQALRLLGVAQVGAGQLAEAAETWSRWLQLSNLLPHEKARERDVEEYREAAQVLAEAMRKRHE